jgi:hypothetical protein
VTDLSSDFTSADVAPSSDADADAFASAFVGTAVSPFICAVSIGAVQGVIAAWFSLLKCGCDNNSGDSPGIVVEPALVVVGSAVVLPSSGETTHTKASPEGVASI